MAQHYIPKDKVKSFGGRSEIDASLISEEAFLLSRRIDQYVGLSNASDDSYLRDSAATRLATAFMYAVDSDSKTKAESYNEIMGELSGGTTNEFRILYGVHRGVRGISDQQDRERLNDIVSSIEKYGANTNSVKWAADFSKRAQESLGGDDPLSRAEAAIEELERNPGPLESVDKGKFIEAALFNVSYEDYMSGKAQDSYEERSRQIVDRVTNDIARRAHSIMEEEHGLREYDVKKAIAIDQNPNWRDQYPDEIQGERLTSLTDTDRFEAWKVELNESSPERARLLDDSRLYEEYYSSVVRPNEAILSDAIAKNDIELKERRLDEMVLNERDAYLTDDQKRAEFPLISGTPEYTELRAKHDAIVREKLKEREARYDLEAAQEKEAEAQVIEEAPEVAEPVEPTEEVPEAPEVNDSVSDSDSAKGEVTAKEKDEVDQELPVSEAPQVEEEGPEVEAGAEKNVSGQSLFLSNLEKQKEAEVTQEIDADTPSLKDLTPEQKEANKLLGIKGKDIEEDLASLKSAQERTMLLDHLQNSPEGRQEFDNYIAARAGRLKENTGLKGGKLYSKTSAIMMQMSTEELKEEFPDAARTLEEERSNLDVREEVQFYKENINPELTQEEEARVVSSFQYQKQVDARLGSPDNSSVRERLEKVAKGYRNEDGSLKKGKLASTLATVAFGSMAVASGGAVGIAAFIGAKAAMHYASKAIDATMGLDKPVGDSLVKSGHVSKEDIEAERATQLVKAKEKRWPRVLKAAALVGIGLGIGSLTGNIDFDQTKDSFATLVSEGKDLFKGLGDSTYAMLTGAEAATPIVSEEAIEAAKTVREGVSVPKIDKEAIDASLAVAEGAKQAVEPVIHIVQSGDTMSQIVYNYLSEHGIKVTGSDLYGPDGILEQTGMNRDLIHVGEEIDLSPLEPYLQAQKTGIEFTPDVAGGEVPQGAPEQPAVPTEPVPSSPTADQGSFSLEDAKQQISDQIKAMGPEGGVVEVKMADGRTFSMEVGPETLAGGLSSVTNFMNETVTKSVTSFMDEAATIDKSQFAASVSQGMNELGKGAGVIEVDVGGGEFVTVEVGEEFMAGDSKPDLLSSLGEGNHYQPDENSGPSGP